MFSPPPLSVYCWRTIRCKRHEQLSIIKNYFLSVSSLPDDSLWHFALCRRCMENIVIGRNCSSGGYCETCRKEKISTILSRKDIVIYDHAMIEYRIFQSARVPCILCRKDFSTLSETLILYQVCLPCIIHTKELLPIQQLLDKESLT